MVKDLYLNKLVIFDIFAEFSIFLTQKCVKPKNEKKPLKIAPKWSKIVKFLSFMGMKQTPE